MTKLQNYDQLEIDERPRVCGGAVFLKLMKKGNCVSSDSMSGKNNNNDSPDSTSSSSFSSSQASSTIEFDPTRAHFCMPRQQIEQEHTEEICKLDFKLRAEEHNDFYYHNKDNNEGSSMFFGAGVEPHGIVKLNPKAVNQLKTMHFRSINGDASGNDAEFEPIEDAWNQQLEKQASTESKASTLRKEMSSFRKELNAVRRSLPNQFETNYFCEDYDDEREKVSGEKSKGATTIPQNQNHSKGDSLDFDQMQYFKDDWDLNFRDRSETTPRSPVLEPGGSFPECPEMPFENQGLNPEEITPTNSATPDEVPEEREPTGLSPKSKFELEQLLNPNFLASKQSVERETAEENRASSISSSTYEEDMKIVRMLLKKYGENITNEKEKRRFDKARHLHAIVGPSTDAWFHRHASGVCLTPEKLSTAKAVEMPTETPLMVEPSIPEKPKPCTKTKETPPAKKSVHFMEPAVAQAVSYESVVEEKPIVRGLKNSPGLRTDTRQLPINGNTVTTPTRRSPGRLSSKIQFWEEKKI